MNKTIVLTGGGSAGHVTPNMALIPYLLQDGWDIHYVGTADGMERQLIEPLQHVTYHVVSSGKLRRYFSLKNFSDPFRVGAGISQARKLMKSLRPNVVFAKGGFVSVPVVYGAKGAKVPAVLHESDYSCGLANKLCMRACKTICVSFEPTLASIKDNKGVWTGSPIRQELQQGDAKRAQAFCKFADPARPWITFMGGSLGAAALNQAVAQSLEALCDRYNVVHICGKGKLDPSLSHPNYRQYEFLGPEIPHLFAATDVMVCRAGANTLFELLALHLPALLVPLPATQSRGDQILNARFFEKNGYSRVLLQEDLTAQTLLEEIERTRQHAPSLRMAMKNSPVQDGTRNVLREIYRAAGLDMP